MYRLYYTGIGSNPSGVHTEEEFMTIMRGLFKGWSLPESTLCHWMLYAGAEYYLD